MLWLTDLHLDRCTPAARLVLEREIAASSASPLLITGDISNSQSLVRDLEWLADLARRPIYFVLGNHDHYGASVGDVRDQMIALAEHRPELQWLPRAGVVRLADGSALAGVDGWADGRHGDPLKTPLRLNDDRLILELARQDSRLARLTVKRALADADAKRLATLLDEARESGPRRIVVATHVPPFVAALRPGSRAAHPHWHPLLVSGATGEVLSRFAAANPEISILVLCGHSHEAYEAGIAVNLRVRVGRPKRIEDRR